jgi:hypothetical protein
MAQHLFHRDLVVSVRRLTEVTAPKENSQKEGWFSHFQIHGFSLS